jgi:hypothetical protein
MSHAFITPAVFFSEKNANPLIKTTAFLSPAHIKKLTKKLPSHRDGSLSSRGTTLVGHKAPLFTGYGPVFVPALYPLPFNGGSFRQSLLTKPLTNCWKAAAFGLLLRGVFQQLSIPGRTLPRLSAIFKIAYFSPSSVLSKLQLKLILHHLIFLCQENSSSLARKMCSSCNCSQGKIRTASQRSIGVINHTPQKGGFRRENLSFVEIIKEHIFRQMTGE